ncbi:MAG: DUF3822 family protein [Ferruginibacter sp.]|nr:DUF3822 family protein [Ferruginibacter sp.]
MKALFNSTTDEHLVQDAGHILIEAGSYGLTIIWYHREEKAIKGIQTFQYVGTDANEYPAQIQQVLRALEIEDQQVRLLYNNKESLPVPVEYHPADADARMMGLFFGNEEGIMYCGKVQGDDQTEVIYRVCAPVARYFESHFPGIEPAHATQFQIAGCTEGITCTIYPNYIKVFLVQHNVLQLVQYFDFQTPKDAAYHLLNICDIYSINREAVSLKISGMIDPESNLYSELSRYFLNIQPDHAAISWPDSMDASTHHYFSQLTAALS